MIPWGQERQWCGCAGKDWLENLLEEEASKAWSGEEGEEGEGEAEEEELNPFADHVEDADPWAAFQQREEEEPASSPAKEPAKRKRRRKAGVSKLKKKGESVVGLDSAYSASEFLRGAQAVERAGSGGGGFGLSLSRVEMVKAELLSEVERLGEHLPPNTLDQLITELGGAEAVAEMTGRKGRVVGHDDGEIYYQLRHSGDVPLEILNLTEKNRFMNGEKKIAIISEAASSGISLQVANCLPAVSKPKATIWG